MRRAPTGKPDPRQMALPWPLAPLPALAQAVLPDARQETLHALCLRWVHWQATRRYYAPPAPRGTLARIAAGEGGYKTLRLASGGGGDAANDARLAAFHLAWLAQHEGAGKRAFNAYYLGRAGRKQRPLPAKVLAARLGVGRQHFHTLLAQFRERTWLAARAILDEFGRG